MGLILGLFWGHIGIMETEMETLKQIFRDMGLILGLFWGHIGIMETEMETSIVYI